MFSTSCGGISLLVPNKFRSIEIGAVTSVTVICGKVRTSGVKSGNLVGLLARDVAGSVVKFPESEIHFSHHDDFSADCQSGVRAEKQD